MDIWRWHITKQQLVIIIIAVIAIISGFITLMNRTGGSHGLSLTSPAFKNGSKLGTSATCDGTDINPAFEIKNIPATAKSLAIIAEDKDLTSAEQKRPNSNLWLVFNIPITTSKITEGIRPPGTITRNLKGNFNYNGPCPSKGKTDKIVFTLYALNTPLLPINSSASTADFQKAIRGKVVDKTELSANYTRAK